MRSIARLIIGVAVVLALTAAGLALMRKPLAAAAIEQVMRSARLDNPEVAVDDAGLSAVTLRSMTAGADKSAPALSLQTVRFEYGLYDLLFHRRLRAAKIGEGRVEIVIGEDGAISMAGWTPDPNAPRAAPPLRAIEFSKLDVILATPEGPMMIAANGALHLTRGGKIAFKASSERAGFAAARIENASGEGELFFAESGAFEAQARLAGDIAAPAGAARGVALTATADLNSWRGFFGEAASALDGAARIAIEQSSVATENAPALGALLSSGGSTIRMLSVSGAVDIAFRPDGVVIRADKDPLYIASDRGDRLAIRGADGPLYARRGDSESAALSAALESPAGGGEVLARASREGAAPWRVTATSRFGAATVTGVDFKSFAGGFEGGFDGNALNGVAQIETDIARAVIGRLTISNMPVRGRFDIAADIGAARASATPVSGQCVAIAKADLKFAEQDMDARVADASLCADTEPLLSIGWGAQMSAGSVGALSAKTAYYRLGQTVFDGAPPEIDYVLNYRPDLQESAITGTLAGGRVTLNSSLRLSEVAGDFKMNLVRDEVTADVMIAAMRIAETASPERVAPVNVSGRAVLADDMSNFDFLVATPQGVALGRGEGAHDVLKNKGEAIFDSGDLVFSPRLQPDRVIPALKGIIGVASGKAEGRARFAWDAKGVESSATVNLDNVSFQGPGVAVTRTERVSGTLVFPTLAPVSTAGVQTISIGRVDMDALKLDNGQMQFALPGDDTLKIVEAEFPWFDGKIGVYDSLMSIGGKSETTLEIADVNIATLLEFINVDGLSGEGMIGGVLPLTIEGGKATINNGAISSKGPGVIRYEGKMTDAAAATNSQSALAFDVLRELKFEKLSATLNGPLDGTVDFRILFEGRSAIPVKTGNRTQLVDSPIKYRININAPLLSLVEQAILSGDFRKQIERARAEEAARAAGEAAGKTGAPSPDGATPPKVEE